MQIRKQQKELIKVPRRKITTRDWQMYSLCAIPLILVFIFSYLPMGGLIIAFKDYRYADGIFGSKWVWFDNFKFFLTSNDFLRLVRNTVGLNVIFIIVNMAAAVGLAILLFELKSRNATKVYQTVLITPHFLSWVIVSYMVYAFLQPQSGMLNQLLTTLGMKPVDWYGTPGAWPFILTIANVWKHIGMDSVLYYAALMGIDQSLFEAAEVDGAKKWHINFYIIIPSIVPIIVMLLIRSVAGIFRADFGLFYQLTRDVSVLYPVTDVLDTYIFRAMRKIGDMGMSSAAGFMQSLVGFILVNITNWIARKADEELALF